MDISQSVEQSEEWARLEREDHHAEWGFLVTCIRCETEMEERHYESTCL